MADQNLIYKENENKAEKSEIKSDAEFDPRMLTPKSENENEAEKSEIDSDAEFDPQMLTTKSDQKLPLLAPHFRELYKAAMFGKWETAKAIIRKDPNAKTKRISPLGFTALHVAASCGRSEFVVELLKHLTEDELEIRDQLGRTALHFVALAASLRAAKAMVEKNPNLCQLGDMDLQTPFLYAAQWRRRSKSKEMLEYLYQVTKDEPPCRAFTGRSASNLIVAITASGSYDIALCILGRYPELAYTKNDEGMSILHVLAMQPSAFRSGNKLSLWKTFHWKKVTKIKRRDLHAVRLVEFVCKDLQKESITDIQDFFIPKDDIAILHLATEHGVLEFVQICLNYFPDLIWYANAKKRLLLHVAIEHRRVEIFNYIINLIGNNIKAYTEIEVDEDCNNSLHLAAKLALSSDPHFIPSPAFLMQRELQWFKAVEGLVYYKFRTGKNKMKQTPRELFFQQHEVLLADAKEWMKYISNSCMPVATLVATVAFAAMITVPGGNNNEGIPIFSKEKIFITFFISNALSMISSVISLLMFLSVQTSRYTEEDFRDTLPKLLRTGLIFLFIAVATMMISFGTAIGLSLQKRVNWACILIAVVACCPAIIFTRSQRCFF